MCRSESRVTQAHGNQISAIRRRRYPQRTALSVPRTITFAVADSEEHSGVEPGSILQNAVTVFPLKHLPSLKHLEVQTDLQLAVNTLIPDFLKQGESKFPALRSLKFGGPQLKIHKWVGFLMLCLKQQGNWEMFEELNVPPELALPGVTDGVMHGEAISRWIRANINPKWVRDA